MPIATFIRYLKGAAGGAEPTQEGQEEGTVPILAKPESIFVVVAAFNESARIESVVADLRTAYPNIIVVDDGSADATAACALAAGAVVLRHPVNLGQGAALQTGITYALQSGAEYVATFDADGQHATADLAEMAARLVESGADVALGSRFLGQAVGLSPGRRLVLQLAVLFTRLTTGLQVTDAHNGLRLFTRAAACRIRITENRMAHASEIPEEIARHRLKFVEVPVRITYSPYSRAKGQKLLGAVTIIGDLILGRLARGH